MMGDIRASVVQVVAKAMVGLLVGLLVVGLLPIIEAKPASAQIPTRPTPGPMTVTITNAGFDPQVVSIVGGQTLIVVNATATPQTYTAGDGWIDSGPIAPGGRFVLTPSVSSLGVHPVSSTATPAFTGMVSVALLSLPHTGSNFVSSTSLTTWAPTATLPDIHPKWGVAASRNRALVTFTSNASITQATNAFAAANVNVIGAMRDYRLVAVEVPDPGEEGNFTALDTAVAALRTQTGVTSVSYDFGMTPEATVPRPVEDDPGANPVGNGPGTDYSWSWDESRTSAENPAGTGGNSGMESSNVPYAWNLVNTLSALTASQRPDVVVLDLGFEEGHPDAPFTRETICMLGQICVKKKNFHGTAVASVIGAPFDRAGAVPGTSAGIQGVSPAVDIHAVDTPDTTFGVDNNLTNTVFMIDRIGTLKGILDARSSQFPRLRAVNISLGGISFSSGQGGSTWPALFNGKVCGPGLGDDSSGTQPCTPNNEDTFNREVAAAGEAHRGVVAAYGSANVLIVHAAGNESEGLDAACVPFGATDPPCQPIEIRSDALVPLIRLERIWGTGTPPILAVEAYNTIDGGGDPVRDDYSNIGGDVSAPGNYTLAADGQVSPPRYHKFNGTSAAAPYVTGLIAMLQGLRGASVTPYADMRRMIIESARDDVGDGGAPRIDAFQAAMRVSGSAARLVDVNDPSADGNRRVIYDVDGVVQGEDMVTSVAGQRGTASDSKVDLRDFRRFRDAFLRSCQTSQLGDPGCPASFDVSLDGDPATNPHFDLNLDGCLVGPCEAEDFSRFDFNADGKVNALDAAPVPINSSTGVPLAAGATSNLTDLDVLRSVWGTGTAPATNGWIKADLDALLSSADVQVDTADLFAGGATKVEVQGFSGVDLDPTPAVTLTQTPAQPLVLSVPVSVTDDVVPGGSIRVLVTTTWGDGSSTQWVSSTMRAKIAQDIAIRPCSNMLSIESDQAIVRAGDTDVDVTATLEGCFGVGNIVDVNALPVTFSLEGDAEGGTLHDAELATDDLGKARVKFDAADDFEGDVSIVATVDVHGVPISAVLPLGIVDPPTIWYRWRQTNLDYERDATNDKGGVGDDCRADLVSSGTAHCFRSTQSFDNDNVYSDFVYGAERRGVIEPAPTGSGAPLVSEAGRFFNELGATGDLHLKLEGERATDQADPFAVLYDVEHRLSSFPATIDGQLWSQAYVEHPVPELSMSFNAEGVVLENLAAIGDELYYPTTFSATPRSGSEMAPEIDMPIMASRAPSELLLTRRADRSSFQFSDDLDTAIALAQFEDGTYDSYDWCGVVSQDFSAIPEGYYADTDPWLWGLRPSELRSPTRSPDSRYAPTSTGTWKARFELVMVATDGSEPTDEQLEFGDCTATEPAASIEIDPEPVKEGDDVTLRVAQAASLPSLTYSWKMGDGVESDMAEPQHSYDDNGTYPVEVTRSSSGQAVNQLARDVVVTNVAPEIESIEDVYGQQEPTIPVRVADPGPVDALALGVSVKSTSPGFVAPADRFLPAGDGLLPLGEQLPGTYTVTVTVTDKDGGKDVRSVQVWVPTAEEAAEGLSGEGSPVGDGGGEVAAISQGGLSAALGPVSDMGATPAAVELASTGVSIAALDAAPVAAYTINPTSTTTGAAVTVVNRSRANGSPIAASMAAGDGRAAVPVSADATMSVSYLEPGSYALALTAGAAPGTTASSSVVVTGGSLAPTLTYGPGGATSGAQGALVTVRGRLLAPGSVGVGGRTMNFTLGASTASAVTGSDGFAAASIVVPNTPGAATLNVVVPAAGSSPERTVNVGFTITANTAPVAVSGGPYQVGLNGDLALDGSGSSDADAGQTATLAYAWDLDGDGTFTDDAALGTGVRPAPISWTNVNAIVCHGTCVLDQSYPIGLRVTDSTGAVTITTTTVNILRDFGLSIAPATATLVPGASVSFTVSVFSSSGFTTPVALSATGLPAGVTASFNPASVAPGGTSILTLTATAAAIDTDFALVVRGMAGGLTRQAGGAIDMEFGLVPTCTGAVTGRVIHARTGVPIAGASVSNPGSAVTAADGTFSISNLALGSGNAPRGYGLRASAAGFWMRENIAFIAACGVVSTVEVALQPVERVTISGTVRTAEAPQSPITTARVGNPWSTEGITESIPVGGDGSYEWTFTLFAGATEEQRNLRAGVAGRHSDTNTVALRAGENPTDVDFHLEQLCHAKVQARAINKDTGRPVPGARISFESVSGTFTAGADGRYTSPDIPLAPIRAPLEVQVQARSAVGEPNASNYKNIMLSGCGVTIPVDIEIDYPDPDVTATLDVLVIDDETDEVIPDATVNVRFTSTSSDLAFPKTDAAGHSSRLVTLGAGTTTRSMQHVSASKTGYLWKSTAPLPITMTKDQTSTTTVRLQKKRYGAIEGTVRDAVTGLSIAGVRPSTAGGTGTLTGADGRYRIDGIELGLDGAPVSRSLGVSTVPSGYWTTSVGTIQVGPGVTTKDIELIPICAGATIRGRIVDATTRQPIPTARATIQSFGFDNVDADGRFVLTPVPVAFENKPVTLTVTASATGYQSASKNVTIFCGANIVVDFGFDQDGTGTIVGTVTDDATDLPVVGAFVGTEFGGTDTTDALGRYEIAQAPAGPDNGPRDWVVTVVPTAASGLGQAQKTATVLRNQSTTVDFALGEFVEPAPDNVAPVAAIVATPGASVAEGSTIGLSAATSFDPDSSPGGLTYAWDLDDDGQFDDGTAVTATVQRADNGGVTVKVRVTDAGTVPGPLSDTETLALTWTNAVPVVTTMGAVSPTISRRVDVGATFTDVGTADTHTATINWGDGSPLQTVAVTPGVPGVGTVASTPHVYNALGARTIEVCVTDDDSGKGCHSVTLAPVGVVPGPPVDVSAIGGDGEARLKWKAPTSDGGSALLEYGIETTPGGAVVTVPGADLTRVVAPLTNNSDYTFRVRASNQYGWGPWSTPSNVTRPRSSCAGSAFSDVGADHPFCPEIKWMGDTGVSIGFPGGTYRPTQVITRGAMAAFSYRLLNPGVALPACTEAPFSDVPVSDTFCPEVTWMRDSGTSTGYSDGTYRSGAPVSRQAMAAFLYRLDAANSGQDPECTVDEFIDVLATDPFCGEIRWLVGTGIAEGNGGRYSGTGAVPRQAMAAFIFRYNIYAGLIP